MRRPHDRDVIILEDEGTSGVTWFLLGAALGAGLALLFAPASGDETRARLRRGVGRLRDTAEDALEELRDEFVDLKDRAEEKVDQVKAAARGVADEVEDAAEELTSGRRRSSVGAAREELERRLAEARARRRQPAAEDQEPVA